MREMENDLVRVGVSPHAPYTVSAPQLELISRLAIDQKLPVMMHAAESQAEKLFMLEGRGVFAFKPISVVEAGTLTQNLIADLLLRVGQCEFHH